MKKQFLKIVTEKALRYNFCFCFFDSELFVLKIVNLKYSKSYFVSNVISLTTVIK